MGGGEVAKRRGKANDNARNANVMFGVGAAVAVAGVITLIAMLASAH